MSEFPVFCSGHTETYNDFDVGSLISYTPWETHHQPTADIIPPAYWQFDQQQQPPLTAANIHLDEYSTKFGLMHEQKYPVKSSDSPQDHGGYSGPINCLTKNAYHNARERHRRRTLKALYSQLRMLIPNQNPKKKLSIASTVCGIVKYIPELLNQIKKLSRERDALLAISKRSIFESSLLTSQSASNAGAEGSIYFMQSLRPAVLVSPDNPGVIVNPNLGRSQMIITIYNCRVGFLFSILLALLRKEGLDVLNASTVVCDDKVCHHLHLKMFAGRREVDPNLLRRKILVLLCDKYVQMISSS